VDLVIGNTDIEIQGQKNGETFGERDQTEE
jgi:hypothetical protein